MPRPPLGVLRLSTGDLVTLDRSVLLGRAPKLGEGIAVTDRPHVVKVPSPERDVSRNHVDVVLDNRDVVRTFLNEARMLDAEHRARVIEARDHYEAAFRTVVQEGVETGELRSDLDPKLTSIFVLSILNAIERWYDPSGEIGRDELVDRITDFASSGVLVTIG